MTARWGSSVASVEGRRGWEGREGNGDMVERSEVARVEIAADL